MYAKKKLKVLSEIPLTVGSHPVPAGLGPEPPMPSLWQTRGTKQKKDVVFDNNEKMSLKILKLSQEEQGL